MAATRRLAAILVADVAGYSRLMGADEEGTRMALTALRRKVVDPKVAEYRGRLALPATTIPRQRGVTPPIPGASTSENPVPLL